MSLQLSRRQMLRSGLVSAAALPFARLAWAQAWPSKPIKIVCGYPAGGLTDLFARAYGDYISQKVGQPVVVENKPGAGGTIAAQAVKSSPRRRLHADVHDLDHHDHEPRALQDAAL